MRNLHGKDITTRTERTCSYNFSPVSISTDGQIREAKSESWAFQQIKFWERNSP